MSDHDSNPDFLTPKPSAIFHIIDPFSVYIFSRIEIHATFAAYVAKDRVAVFRHMFVWLEQDAVHKILSWLNL